MRGLASDDYKKAIEEVSFRLFCQLSFDENMTKCTVDFCAFSQQFVWYFFYLRAQSNSNSKLNFST